MSSFDLAVLGGGPGGYAVAFRAADLGMKVALVDRSSRPGGTCLYRGCIPSKALLHLASLLREAEESRVAGIVFGSPRIDIVKIRTWKNEMIEKMTLGLDGLVKKKGITYFHGVGKFENSGSLVISGEEGESKVEFKNAVVAVGTVPSQGDFKREERINTSDELLDLPDIPEDLLIIGGGYIGLELGTVYSALGSRVTLVEALPRLLAGVDRDLVLFLERRLGKYFSSLYKDTTVKKLKSRKVKVEALIASPEGEETKEFDRVLVSVGRTPATKKIGLEKTEVTLNERGFIISDNAFRTEDDRIWVLGDASGGPLLAHKALREGRLCAELLNGNSIDRLSIIPSVIYTDPEIAWCGLTEEEARQKKINVRASRFPWAASGRALSMNRGEGMTKLVLDPADGRVLGMGAVGFGASEIIMEGVIACEKKMKARDLADMVHPHPTLGESVMEAAQVFLGESSHFDSPVSRLKG